MEQTVIEVHELEERLERTERAKREATEGINKTRNRAFQANTIPDLLLVLAYMALRRIRLWWLSCRRDTLRSRLSDARRRVLRQRHAAFVQAYEAERERGKRIGEAVLELRRRHRGRPAIICGREPENEEELRLVEEFLAGADERHRLCMEAWRRGDSVRERRVRKRMERDLPLRRYERERAARARER